jgi:hypothetical protein
MPPQFIIDSPEPPAMSQPASHVARTRAAITRFTAAVEELQGCASEYVALGGQSGVDDHWLEEDGVTPRTDLDLTLAEYVSAVSSIDAVITLLGQGHSTNLYRAKG